MLRVRCAILLLLSIVAVVVPAYADDRADIVGRWDNNDNKANYIRFNADGTFKEVAPLNSGEGKWRMIGKQVIELGAAGASTRVFTLHRPRVTADP